MVKDENKREQNVKGMKMKQCQNRNEQFKSEYCLNETVKLMRKDY